MKYWLIILFPLAVGTVALGLVNPKLQPGDLYDRYRVVATLRVADVDLDARQVRLKVVQIVKGKLEAEELNVTISGDAAEAAADELLINGSTVVAFIGTAQRGQERDVLFYPGSGRWQSGQLEQRDNPSGWTWDKDLELELFGTFNGPPDRLAEMMTDRRDGRYFFPATPHAGFKQAITLARLPGAVMGVALYDLNDDGRLDVVGCSAAGDRAWLQTAPLTFTDRTGELGLTGSASRSVAIGDVNGDSIADLLLDAQVWLGSGQSQSRLFTKSDGLPTEASVDFKAASLVDVNSDGWPDVVVSRRGRGLAVYLNAGSKEGRFKDATATMGLDAEDCGHDGDGFFSPGDWNGDGRTDLFYAVRNGLILVQGADGRFAAVEHDLDIDLSDAEGLGGTAVFAPLWTADGGDVVFSTGVGVHLLVNVKGRARERTASGNELTETSFKQLAMIAEDLDADGSIDLFVASRQSFPCKLFANRGYGSFTCPTKYKAAVIPDEAAEFAVWGLAAGDVDGDGANDLLLGGVDGRILLLINRTLNDRPLEAPVGATLAQQVLANTRILSARVSGKGTIGAQATLTDANGRAVGRLRVVGNVATGCRGPDTLNFTVRHPGPHTLTVQFSDGAIQKWTVDLATEQRRIELHAARNNP